MSAEVLRGLRRLAAQERMLGRPVGPARALGAGAVGALEAHLRTRLSDDVLAVLSSGAASLAPFALGSVGARSEEAWLAGLSKARLVLGPAGPRQVCVPRRGEPGAPVRVTFFDPGAGTEGDGTTLAAWLERLTDAARGDGELDEDAWAELERLTEAEPFTPCLEPAPGAPPPAEGPRRRVRHPRFGVGEVRRQIPGTEKIEIDFGPAGVRTLVARYVEDEPC